MIKVHPKNINREDISLTTYADNTYMDESKFSTVKQELESIKTDVADIEGNIPTKTSQLYNDSGFLTEHQDISGKADKATTLAEYGITDGVTKSELNALNDNKIAYTDVVDNLESTDTDKPLSAYQGRVLDRKKANVNAWDASSLTLEGIYEYVSKSPGLFFAGRTKLPASCSPTGTQNWFRCIWECQNANNLSGSGLNAIAMLNSSIWNGHIATESDGSYVLKWFKLVRQEDIVDNLLSTNVYVPLSANQGKVLNDSLSSHTSNKINPHSVTKAQVGLGNVENKSSATIRGELTKANVTNALGFVPYKIISYNTISCGNLAAGGSIYKEITYPNANNPYPLALACGSGDNVVVSYDSITSTKCGFWVKTRGAAVTDVVLKYIIIDIV